MAALEAVSSNEPPFNFIIYDTISASPYDSPAAGNRCFLPENCTAAQEQYQIGSAILESCNTTLIATQNRRLASCAINPKQGMVRKKRKRKPRVCKNKEEAETQRMTHIAVERNRRKQMNDHLAILRSLMPDSYAQRGDQASIVGGAIEFVKELEHLLMSLETHKNQILPSDVSEETSISTSNSSVVHPIISPFSQIWRYDFPQVQYSWPHQQQSPNKYTLKTKADIADIEVTLIETHANIRILTRRINPRQLSKIVAGIQTLQLTILHLTVNTVHPFVNYSISVKIEEGCLLNSVDEIAGAFHHMLRLLEEAAVFCQLRAR